MPRILFIDDEYQICTLAAEILGRQGFDIEIFQDGYKALRKFTDNPGRYDIVVSDQAMPAISGLYLLRKLREIRGNIPEILCMDYGDPLDNVNKYEEKIDAFFTKPYSFSELIGQIEKLL